MLFSSDTIKYLHIYLTQALILGPLGGSSRRVLMNGVNDLIKDPLRKLALLTSCIFASSLILDSLAA